MFDALFGRLPGYVEFRFLSSGQREFIPLEYEHRAVLVTFAQHLPALKSDQDCFYGIATRRTTGSGKRENCGYLPAVFVDIDFQSSAHPNAVPEAEARRRLNAFQLPPSVIVHSGGGLHVCWLLKEAIDLARDGDKAKTLLRALARATGGDLQAAEPVRVLRLPGSFNHKYDPPREVVIEAFESERRYMLGDFDCVLVIAEQRTDLTDLASGVIPDGRRNTTLTSLAGTMRRRGMSEKAIRVALHTENDNRCLPPLPSAEVDRIVNKMMRYAPNDGQAVAVARPAQRQTVNCGDAPIEGRALLDDLVALLQRYVVVGLHEVYAIALWALHTHAFPAAETTPYLAVTSAMKQSGKTRLLEVLELIVANPWLTGRVTAAVLVRKIDAKQPTLLLDETDAAFKGERESAEALRAILNTGYRVSGTASLCVGQGAKITCKDFTTFCPKALAGIGQLPDTVADRSIQIRLQRKTSDENTARFSLRAARLELEPLNQRLGVWGQAAVPLLQTAVARNVPNELSDRAADVCEPLITIADLVGGSWPGRSREAVVALSGAAVATERASIDDRLLTDLHDLLKANRLPIQRTLVSSRAMVEELNRLEEAQWREFGKQGKALTTTALAARLRKFGMRPVSEGTFRGYPMDRLNDVFARYLPRESSSRQETSGIGPKVENSARQAIDAADDSTPPKSQPNSAVSDMLTGSPSGNGNEPVLPAQPGDGSDEDRERLRF